MVNSSPASRRSYHFSSPERQMVSEFLTDDRNSETRHRDALAAAQAEHERVRAAAIRQLQIHVLQEQHTRLLDLKKKEEERLRAETQLAAEAARLQALRATTIPKPAPPPPSPKAPPPTQKTIESPRQPSAPGPSRVPPTPVTLPLSGPVTTASRNPVLPPIQPQSEPQLQSEPKPQPSKLIPTPTPIQQPNTVPPPSTLGRNEQTHNSFDSSKLRQALPNTAPVPVTTAAAPPAAVPPAEDRLISIHKSLKQLRAYVQEQQKTNPQLKARMGEMRREIRKSMGQLTGGKGANSQPVQKIVATFREALEGRVPSELANVSAYVVDVREPVEGATQNGPALPSLFIYLVNIFSKAVINQFINECGANPKAADPIGVVVAQIFSRRDFFWREKSLIDILLAKFRIACPVLFGQSGDERTQTGRVRVGWRRAGGGWMPEPLHYDRMTGLGAGYAAIALRDFSRTQSVNPYPPRNYWTSMAKLLNTPAQQVSGTQCVVLKAMIENYEQRFIGFYGNAAVAMIHSALVDFPAKAPKSPAVDSLQILLSVIKRDWGLDLA